MHNNCGEIFSGFCRKPVQISESVWTTCEINDFKAHSFPIFQRSSWKWTRAWGRWCSRGCGWKGGEGVGHIRVKIKLTTFCMHLTLFNQVQVDVHVCSGKKGGPNFWALHHGVWERLKYTAAPHDNQVISRTTKGTSRRSWMAFLDT